MGWRIIYVSPPGKACLVSRWGLSQFPVKPASNPGRFVSRFPVGGCFESRWKPVSDPSAFKNVIAGVAMDFRPSSETPASMLASQPVSMQAGMLAGWQRSRQNSMRHCRKASQLTGHQTCPLAG